MNTTVHRPARTPAEQRARVRYAAALEPAGPGPLEAATLATLYNLDKQRKQAAR